MLSMLTVIKQLVYCTSLLVHSQFHGEMKRAQVLFIYKKLMLAWLTVPVY